MHKVTLLTITLFLFFAVSAQQKKDYRTFWIEKIKNAKTLKEKVYGNVLLGAEYYVLGEPNKTDSLIKEGMNAVYENNDAEIEVYALLLYSDLTNYPQPKYPIQSIEWARKGLDIAKSKLWFNYQPAFYGVLTSLYSARGDWENATTNFNQCIAQVNEVKDDSIKIIAYRCIAQYFETKKNYSQAFSYYNKALHCAEKIKSYTEQDFQLTNLSNLYRILGDYEKARSYANKTMEAAQKVTTDSSYTIEAYGLLSQICQQQKKFDFAEKFAFLELQKANEIGYEQGKIGGVNNLFNIYTQNKDFDKTRKLVKDNPDFAKMVSGIYGGTDINGFAKIFEYQNVNKYDSVVYYFEKTVVPFYHSSGETPSSIRYLLIGGQAYIQLKNYEKGLGLLEKVFKVSSNNYDYGTAGDAAKLLDTAYRNMGKWEKALYYNTQYFRFKDTLQQLKQDKDIALAEVNEEETRQAEQAKEEEAQTNQRHSLQYALITSLVVLSFIGLVAMGAFKVSEATIKYMGFFSFIFFFEFIFLLAEKQLHNFTHEEPWKELLIMIVLAAVLLPLHHLLEHKVVHYLSHNKLILPDRKKIAKKLFKGGAEMESRD